MRIGVSSEGERRASEFPVAQTFPFGSGQGVHSASIAAASELDFLKSDRHRRRVLLPFWFRLLNYHVKPSSGPRRDEKRVFSARCNMMHLARFLPSARRQVMKNARVSCRMHATHFKYVRVDYPDDTATQLRHCGDRGHDTQKPSTR